MSTYVETIVQERLRPVETVPSISAVNKIPPSFRRTTSLDRIRQIPNYFCRQTSTEIQQWILSSKTKFNRLINDISKQFHLILLTVSVYAVISIIAVELAATFAAILLNEIPSGLIFLLSCVGLMSTIAVKIMPLKSIAARSRTRTRRVKND